MLVRRRGKGGKGGKGGREGGVVEDARSHFRKVVALAGTTVTSPGRTFDGEALTKNVHRQ